MSALTDEILAYLRAAVGDHADLEALSASLAKKITDNKKQFFEKASKLSNRQRENVVFGLGIFTLVCWIGITIFVCCEVSQYANVPPNLRPTGLQLVLSEAFSTFVAATAVVAMALVDGSE